MFMGTSRGLTSHKMLGRRDAATTYSSEVWLCRQDASLLPNSDTMILPTE